MNVTSTTSLPTVLLYTVVVLVCGSAVRFAALRKATPDIRRKRLASLRTWWLLTLVVSGAVAFGKLGVCILFCAVSCMAVREYASIVLSDGTSRSAVPVLYAIAALTYLLIAAGRTREFFIISPVGILFVLAGFNLLKGEPRSYVRSTGGLFFGAITVVYGLSHAALLFVLPQFAAGPAGAAGWFLYLLMLTELNDIAQALIGRRFAERAPHRITPVISPNKTWEGFVGGAVVTVILAFVLHPWLTALDTIVAWPETTRSLLPAAVGLLICVTGFFGDINMSAVKRDAGVKDSGTLLPGMGGLIDRVDSLTFTGPAFVYFMLFAHRGGTLW